jgi:hypothetical protein
MSEVYEDNNKTYQVRPHLAARFFLYGNSFFYVHWHDLSTKNSLTRMGRHGFAIRAICAPRSTQYHRSLDLAPCAQESPTLAKYFRPRSGRYRIIPPPKSQCGQCHTAPPLLRPPLQTELQPPAEARASQRPPAASLHRAPGQPWATCWDPPKCPAIVRLRRMRRMRRHRAEPWTPGTGRARLRRRAWTGDIGRRRRRSRSRCILAV